MKARDFWVVGLFFLLAFGGASPNAAFAAKEDVVVGLVAEPVSFDVPTITDLNTMRVLRRVFEGLTDLKLGTYEVGPGLAESWTISDDGKTYTFRLRKGVKFHDGTPFNAQAVKYCLDRQIDPKHPQHAGSAYPYSKSFLGNVESIQAVDDHTVRFILKSSLSPFIHYLAHNALRIMSPESLKKYGKEVTKHPAGTGPFKLKEWAPGVRMVLERNSQYWGGAPKIRNVIYVPIIEAQARLSAIRTGEIDLTVDVPPDSLPMLRKDSNIVVAEAPSAAVWYIVLNTQKTNPPMNNKLVRQAMNYAVNKEAIVRDILKGTGIVAHSPMSPIYGKYHVKATEVKGYPYDPAKAKELLKQAGYPNGFTCNFIVPESGSGMQSPVEMATVIQANLAAVGIKCNIQTFEWGTYLQKFREGPDISEMSWNPSIGDPDQLIYMLLHSSRFPPAFNAGFYKNEKVDELLDKARTTSKEDLRAKYYSEAQKIIVEDAPWIFVDHGNQIVVHRKRLKNFILSPNFCFEFKQASVE
jgi:peptide/nickel transport system substrate-binding protein